MINLFYGLNLYPLISRNDLGKVVDASQQTSLHQRSQTYGVFIWVVWKIYGWVVCEGEEREEITKFNIKKQYFEKNYILPV